MRVIVLFAALALFGCPPKQESGPIIVKPETAGSEFCDAAEKHLLNDVDCKDRRGIRLGSPNKRGQSFADVCRQLYSDGVQFKAKCLSEAHDCQEVAACSP